MGADYSKVVFPRGYSPAKTAGKGQYFDAAAAERAIRFIETYCTHHDGPKAGQPFVLEQWQRDKTATIHGWKNEDGTRRYREVYDEEPRGNGKSKWAAAEGAYFLFAEPEQGKQVFSIAGNEEQARIIFGDAKTMVENHAELKSRATLSKRRITILSSASFFEALSSKPGTKHGLRPNLVLCDELHEFASSELLDALVTGQGKKPQPLTLITTTAGIFDELAICWKKHHYAEQVISGEVSNTAFLPILYSLEPDEDWRDEANWRKVNPNWGISVQPAHLRNEFLKAQIDPLLPEHLPPALSVPVGSADFPLDGHGEVVRLPDAGRRKQPPRPRVRGGDRPG